MPVLCRPAARVLVCALLALPAPPALAQWIAVGRWGSEQSFRFVPPGTWMVLEEDGRTSISAEGEYHDGRLTLSCTAEPGSAVLVFSHYHGAALNEAEVRLSGIPRVAATLAVEDRAFVLHLDQSLIAREWSATLPTPEILDAMAGGRWMELRLASGERVTRIGLGRAAAAREAVRQGCGL